MIRVKRDAAIRRAPSAEGVGDGARRGAHEGSFPKLCRREGGEDGSQLMILFHLNAALGDIPLGRWKLDGRLPRKRRLHHVKIALGKHLTSSGAVVNSNRNRMRAQGGPRVESDDAPVQGTVLSKLERRLAVEQPMQRLSWGSGNVDLDHSS